MNPTPFLEAPFVIQIHALTATAAFVLGALVLWRKKGGVIHKVSGRVWVGLMIIVSLTGFFIHEIRLWGLFSPIHILSITTPLGLIYAIWAVRRGNLLEHKRTMKATYLGGMIIAGGFTFLPGRLNHEIFFGETGFSMQDAGLGALIPLIFAAGIAIYFTGSEKQARK